MFVDLNDIFLNYTLRAKNQVVKFFHSNDKSQNISKRQQICDKYIEFFNLLDYWKIHLTFILLLHCVIRLDSNTLSRIIKALIIQY